MVNDTIEIRILEKFNDLRVIVQELTTQLSLELKHQEATIQEIKENQKETGKTLTDNRVLFERLDVENKVRDQAIDDLDTVVETLQDELKERQGVKKFITKWWYPVIMVAAGALTTWAVQQWII
jgi:hydroxymethylpyrimidine pyrophosphatase-like HAD family hydrolase